MSALTQLLLAARGPWALEAAAVAEMLLFDLILDKFEHRMWSGV